MQYRSFDLSNITRIMGISTNDYTNLIATIQGDQAISRLGGQNMSNCVTYSTINLQPSRVFKNANVN